MTLAVSLLGGWPAALAGPAVHPVIDSHSIIVEFGDTATITGHLENGSAGEVVSLERRKPETNTWVPVASQEVADPQHFVFEREGARTNAFYRLRVDKSTSNEVMIRVRARLILSANPVDLMEGDSSILSGVLRPAFEGRSVLLERRVEGEWRSIGRVLVEDGHYALPTRFPRPGRRTVRATFEGDPLNAGKRAARVVRVHRPSLATWYGPTFFGNHTACGQRLRRGTVGIAHRKLPCGTGVHVLFNGATISLKVIDRGPFTDANWDLTQEAAERIGFYGKEDIGVLVRR